MLACPRCGEENPERAKFCLNCGSPLVGAPAPPEVRKTVTILFADIVNSTGRGEQSDPESTRHTLARYFEAMRGVLERHGGTVEKFIGDAVMAVFGIPTLHEDDALRAVRAARDLSVVLDVLNEQFAASGSAAISLRIGLNTGEVVTGDSTTGSTLVTGDAVNVAARLEQAAGPGEVLMGASTYQLVRERIEAEPLAPLELRGKAEPIRAYRLLTVGDPALDGRRLDTPLVGRVRELRLLAGAFERAVSEDGCHLFTLLGNAGVGKSRLVHEFLLGVRDEAQVLRARCLPYGEGITYWPIVELAQAAASISPSDPPQVALAKLATYLEATDGREAIVERVAVAMGLSDEAVPGEEIFWGVRKLLETIARRRPLVVVIDDLHWAEPTLLDLVEHISDLSREAPILLLAIARPELLDARPHWGGGKLNATTVLLEPLSSEQSIELVTNLLGDAKLARLLQERVGETAEGNPLFVEELVAMLVDEGVLARRDGAWVTDADLDRINVPPTVSALVAARLDHLEPSERDLIGRASVVGKVFQRSAVAELSPPERRPELGARLMALVRKELVRPDRSGAVGDDAFRFRHVLMRDAAYSALPKEQRADLHARFADWLERVAGERLPEYQEVIAYHLEQAHHNRSELGMADELNRALAGRAVGYLGSSGARALARSDYTAAVHLLKRAVALSDDERQRGEMLLRIAEATGELGDIAGAFVLLDQAIGVARTAGDELLAMRAELQRLMWQAIGESLADDEPIIQLADRLEERAKQEGDLRAAVLAEQARGQYYLTRCRWADQLAALDRAMVLLDRLGDSQLRREVQVEVWNALRYGPAPALEAMARIESGEADRDLRSIPNAFLSALRAMRGDFVAAREGVRNARAFMAERGLTLRVGGLALATGMVELLAGDLEAAEEAYADGIKVLGSIGEKGVLSTVAAMQAWTQYRVGRPDEALASIELAKETGASHDIATQAGWRNPAAMIAADRGDLANAERLIGEAQAMVEPTDFLELRGQTWEALAHVHRRAGRLAEAETALRRAMSEHDRKGNLVELARVEGLLETSSPVL